MSGPRQGGEFIGQLVGIEAPVSPRNCLVVDGFVPYAEVMKGRQQACSHSVKKVATENQVVIAQRKNGRAISPVGRCGQTDEKLGCEVVQ